MVQIYMMKTWKARENKSRSRSQEPEARSKEPGARSQEQGARISVVTCESFLAGCKASFSRPHGKVAGVMGDPAYGRPPTTNP